MSNESPELRFDENEYARPNQPWVCGWASEGRACPLGPAKGGRCRSAFECAPYKQGDTWVCARLKSHGGPCEEGPLPDGSCCQQIPKCQPVRTLMARRGVLSLCVFAAAVGCALVMISLPQRESLVSPGPLTPQHSTAVHSCRDCHELGEGGVDDWVHAAIGSESRAQQSGLCLKCHDDMGDHAMQPHGLDHATLAGLTEQPRDDRGHANGSLVLTAARKVTPKHEDGLACATCHTEHHGVAAELSRVTNAQCQVCHVDAFHSFGNGHPEFSDYPYARRTHIYFDHNSHYGRHFATPGEATAQQVACSSCHTSDSAGEFMLVRDFADSCASCHSDQISSTVSPGLLLLNVPAMDVDSLRESEIEIGEWPKLHPQHVAAMGGISPLTKQLLATSPAAAALLDQTASLDLGDLADATDEQRAAVGELAWAFKQMLHDITSHGTTEVARRIGGAVSSNEEARDRFVQRLPLGMLHAMRDRWFPELAAELSGDDESTEASDATGADDQPRTDDSDAGLDSAPKKQDPLAIVNAQRRIDETVAVGWYLRDSDLSLRYRATGHADALLQSWHDLTAAAVSPQTFQVTEAFLQNSSPFTHGRCLKCHAVEDVGGASRVHWSPRQPTASFTKFSHSPHMTLLSEEGCRDCHQLEPDTGTVDWQLYRRDFIRPDFHVETLISSATSDFGPIKKVACAACHTQETAGDSCLTCHSYHVGGHASAPGR